MNDCINAIINCFVGVNAKIKFQYITCKCMKLVVFHTTCFEIFFKKNLLRGGDLTLFKSHEKTKPKPKQNKTNRGSNNSAG